MSIDYSTTWDGKIRGGILIVGKGTAKRYARSIASYMTSAARSAPEDEPVQLVTGSTPSPPLRHFCDADRVWNAGNGYASSDIYAEARIWAALTDRLKLSLIISNVHLGTLRSGQLFVVDLDRFEQDDVGGWTLIERHPVVCANGCPEGYLGRHKFSCTWAGFNVVLSSPEVPEIDPRVREAYLKTLEELGGPQ